MVSSIANIIFLLVHIFNRPTGSWQKPTVVYEHWTVSGYMVHMHRTGIYGYGYGWEISYPRQPWK